MANVTPAMIKELREMTNAGMMDCKKALAESDGDMEGAVEWLRKKGLSSAAKKAGRTAAEGVIAVKISDDMRKGSISEVNCETDFVAQNDNFLQFAQEVVHTVHTEGVSDVEALRGGSISGMGYEERIGLAVSKVGEKVDVRRFVSIEMGEGGVVNGYVHANGKIGVIVGAQCDSAKTAEAVRDILRDIAMHTAAMKPLYLTEDEIPEADIEKEREIAIEQLKKEGKPEAMFDKIIPGKLKKYAKDITLVNQPFVKDDKKSVAQVLSETAKAAGGSAELKGFVRYEVGEGLEKKTANFADEVAAQMKG